MFVFYVYQYYTGMEAYHYGKIIYSAPQKLERKHTHYSKKLVEHQLSLVFKVIKLDICMMHMNIETACFGEGSTVQFFHGN